MDRQTFFFRYNNAVEYISKLNSNYKGFSLENVSKAYNLLGKPCNKKFCIHVAGSNGKGSVSTFIYTALLENRKKTGLYTSPHVLDLNERIQFNGRKISKKEFVFYANKLFSVENPCIGRLTQFEVLTLIALLCFDEKTDFVVLEAGLGGLLDATNVACSQVQVITSVSLEHTLCLGKTKKQILKQKIGIIKKNSLVIALTPAKLSGVIAEKCRQKKCRLLLNGRDFFFRFLNTGFETGTIIEYSEEKSKKSFLVKSRMPGLFQAGNLAIAFAVLKQIKKVIGLKKQKILDGLLKAKIPGRMQLFEKKSRQILFDSAHNPAGIKMLLKSLELVQFKAGIIICGFSCDKNIGEMVRLLSGKTKRIAVTSSGYRAYSPKKIAENLKKKRVKEIKVFSKPEKALSFCIKKDSKILICGSIYLGKKVFLWLSKNGFLEKKCKLI